MQYAAMPIEPSRGVIDRDLSLSPKLLCMESGFFYLP
jgi:hypothetical protein